jgi:hypothetical protein
MQRGKVERGNVSIERLDPRLLTGKPTYLFNIYSNEYTVNLGTCGIWYIPACPEGKPFERAPQAVPGTFEDIYPHFGENEVYRSRAIPGEDIVQAILGTDRPQENITRWGVFSSHNEEPTKAEINAAKQKLIPQLQQVLAKTDQYFASAHAHERQSVYDDKNFRAARFLNVKKPWLSEANEMTVCPFCTIAVSPTASICHGCHQVINQVQFDAMKAQVSGAK